MIQIAIAGSSDEKPLEKAERKAREFARELGKYKDEVILLTGGRSGIMKIVSEEFRKAGGIVVGILPERQEGNEFNTIRIKTGMDFAERSAVMINSADVLVVLGGGIGTMVEALMAYDYGKPLIILTDTGYASDRLELLAKDGYFDHKKIVKVYFVENPKEAVKLALSFKNMDKKSR
ncbi:TIGR00725 family protein [Thermococcus sp. M39]|uniref:TIGR00725 family protein n=1 Tax=unclassified Thermococcus TaxID=2627626 RepID=UPI00143ABE24|nr:MULTISPECIES: TIGR00725 family protein [unclassified Thermococcus]NJE08439.1 TIGR00725 family protein [Thermococcus sp. M39]NJE11942.1 TIGR00725 family protein [Thermococcus sp. LS2]